MINFRKLGSVLASVAMIGSTIGIAAAASYPAPFVQNGAADVAVVYGSNAAATDLVAVTDITANLQAKLAAQTATTGGSSISTSGGDAVSLASGSDLLYLNDELNENVQTLTKDDLATVLADGKFTDDDGTNYDYEQTITVGSGATFAFGNSDNDLTDPTLLLNLPTSTATPIYNLTVTFDEAVNFTDSASEGETLTVFGKTYTIGTATDVNNLVLLGGSDAELINVGETKTLTVKGQTYEVTLNGISSDATPKASITVNGATKTFTEGQTKAIVEGVDLFAKTVFRTGDNLGHVEIEVGADRLTLANGDAVKVGSEDTEIDGTLVGISGGTTAMTKLTIAVSAADNDVNHVVTGGAFADPVFGTVKVQFQAVQNGPVIVGKADTSTTRSKLSIEKGGNRELQVTATDAAGNTKNIPFTYQNATSDDNGNNIILVEGAAIADDEYFILNSGNYQHFMQMTKVNVGNGATDDVAFKDVFTGTSYAIDDKNFASGQTITINNQVYTVTNLSATTVKVTSSDIATNVAVFPYIELVSGEDHMFAFTDDVLAISGGSATSDIALDLPTGTVNVDIVDASTRDCNITISGTGVTTTRINNATRVDTVTIGSVDYVFDYVDTATDSGTCAGLNLTVALESTQSATGDVNWTAPGLLFVEDEDKSEAVTTTKNAVFLKTTDATYSTVVAPVFTGTSDTESFDDSDFTGYVTNFGTYVLFDSSDTNQDFASLTYPKTPMYADVYVAESSASVLGGSSGNGNVAELGSVAVADSEVSSVATKNLVVVGGSCVNSVAADLLGAAACNADFTAKTSVAAGSFLIQTFSRTGGKVATLVAGYNAGDTTNAAKAFTTQAIDTTVGKKYTGSTATSVALATTATTA